MTARKAPGTAPRNVAIPRPVFDRLGVLTIEYSGAEDRSVAIGEVLKLLLDEYDARHLAPRACQRCGARYANLHRPDCFPVRTTEGGTGG